jgi:hypothetical protein
MLAIIVALGIGVFTRYAWPEYLSGLAVGIAISLMVYDDRRENKA